MESILESVTVAGGRGLGEGERSVVVTGSPWRGLETLSGCERSRGLCPQ